MSRNRKKRQFTKRLKHLLFINVFLVSILFLGLGYSLLSTNLSIFGNVEVKEYLEPTLYNVLKNEAKIGTYAQEYTGTHNDSINTSLSTEKVYHWYASVNDTDKADTILDKWNVIFGGFCWQMIRTTDTGGVKMIYNGTPTNGKCNNTGEDQQIGKSYYNGYSSVSFVGYMYNTVYSTNFKGNVDSVYSYSTPAITYWYADSVTWDSTSSKWILDNPYQVSSRDDFPNLAGKYTFHSTDQTMTSSQVRYIVAVNSGTYYYIPLSNGHNTSYYNNTYTYGDNYTDNGNGTYTINSATTIDRLSYYINYTNLNNKYICLNATNDTCNDVWYATSTDKNKLEYLKPANNYKYAQSFTYDSDLNKYILNNDTVTFWNTTDPTNITSLNTHHYTCWNTTGECNTLSYVHNVDGMRVEYIDLNNGKDVNDAINEMLYNDDVNTTNSSIKNTVDNWYMNNMVDYTNYIEDTIFCNDRTQINSELNGWNPIGGDVTVQMKFKNNAETTDISCNKETDKFSLGNTKATLTYPIGITTASEMRLLGNNTLRKTGKSYHLMSPSYINAGTLGVYTLRIHISTDGRLSVMDNAYYGVRPAISLKPGTEFVSGDGSMANPYVVE